MVKSKCDSFLVNQTCLGHKWHFYFFEVDFWLNYARSKDPHEVKKIH